MTNHQPILSGTNLFKQFQIKSSPASPLGMLTAVDDICLDIFKGETHGIAGESGCGKSTLGKIMAGLLQPDKGLISYLGSQVSTLSKEDRKSFRRQTQMIFQDPYSSLNPRMRAGDIIAEPLMIAGNDSTSSCRSKAVEIMQTVGLAAEQYNRFPHEFSGGQRQRIGIARALASSPRVIIADEPVSSLDISIQAQIINLLQDMKSAFSLSLIMVSHDLSVLRHICDRVSIMYLGTIVESATAADLFQRCLHPYTEALISSIPGVKLEKSQSRVILMDDLPSPLAIPSGCRFHPRCRYAKEICRLECPPLEEKSSNHQAACHFSKEIYQAESTAKFA